MHKTAILAALLLNACSSGAEEPDPKALKRVQETTMRQQQEEARYTPAEQAERDRLTATAQLRAKLGSKKPNGGIQMIDGPSRETGAQTFQRNMERLRRSRAEGARTDTDNNSGK